MYGADLFSVFYYHQPFLPLWITGALLWWFVQLAYRRRRGLIDSRQVSRSITMLLLALVSAGLWLGPLPYYCFLAVWLLVRLREFAQDRFLHRLNIALATFMLVSFAGHTALDLQQGIERPVGRILGGSNYARWLQDFMVSGRVSSQQAVEWAHYRQGRLQVNAIYMLRYSHQEAAKKALLEIKRTGPTNLARLAEQSLGYASTEESATATSHPPASSPAHK